MRSSGASISAAVAARADQTLAVMRLDREHHAAAGLFDDARARLDNAPQRRRRQMAHVDMRADRHMALRQMRGDGAAAGDLHQQDHEGRAIDHRHPGHMAADSDLGRHDGFRLAR